jgi:hypothetical protein
MNDPTAFFPFLPDGEGRPVILNKERIIMVTVAASADQDETLSEVGAPVKQVEVECGGLRVEGEVVVDMPVNHSRLLDLLNRPGAFVNVRRGSVHYLVRKSRISRVVERTDAARQA